jgi:hypothetical protein
VRAVEENPTGTTSRGPAASDPSVQSIAAKAGVPHQGRFPGSLIVRQKFEEHA